MANSLNLCQFIGNLGDDVDMRVTPNGTAVANIRIACNWKTKDSEGVEWISVAAFGRLAEIMGEHLRKGSKIYLSGRMQSRKWQDQRGKDNYRTEIIANEMQMLDSRGGDAPQQRSSGGSSGANSRTHAAPPQVFDDSFEDDIPFR